MDRKYKDRKMVENNNESTRLSIEPSTIRELGCLASIIGIICKQICIRNKSGFNSDKTKQVLAGI